MTSSGADVGRLVYLHIGAMKSGTTFVQRMLSRHRDALSADGLLFPGHEYGRQVAAVRDVLDLPGPLTAAELDGAWAHLGAEVAAWDGGGAVVSVEHLSLAREAQVTAIVDSLAPAEVHIVLTARDLGRVLPSSWQETVQNGLTWTWAEYVAAVLPTPGGARGAGQRFWRQHDLLKIIGRWSTAVPPERIHVVTVPGAGSPPAKLWRRFCRSIRIDSSRYPVGDLSGATNQSLDRGAAEMLRQLNLRLGDRLRPAQYVQCVKRPVAKRALLRLPSATPILLRPEHLAWVVERSERVVTRLQERGVDVIGDLRELVPAAQTPPGAPSPAATTEHGPRAGDAAAPGREQDVGAACISAAATASAVVLLKLLAEPNNGIDLVMDPEP